MATETELFYLVLLIILTLIIHLIVTGTDGETGNVAGKNANPELLFPPHP